MKLDTNNGVIVPFCSALNTLFIIGIIVLNKYWDTLPNLLFFLYMFLMITNGVILIIYAAKNNQK